METSWGMFQVMGFNYATVGYSSVREFVKDMETSEMYQEGAFSRYVKAHWLEKYMTGYKEGFAKFAHAYNGPAYKMNKYDDKLISRYQSCCRANNTAELKSEVEKE